MLKRNTKYTAKEILTAAGLNPDEVLGKIRVRISGISGIVKPDHLIKVQPGTEKLDLIVGMDAYEVELEDAVVAEGEPVTTTISEDAKLALDKKAKVVLEKNEKLKEYKEAKNEKDVA